MGRKRFSLLQRSRQISPGLSTIACAAVLLVFLMHACSIQAQQLPSRAGRSVHHLGGAVSQAKDIRALESGNMLQRELGQGETHYYRLRLNRDQYVRVILNQLGVDVVITLLGEDGQDVLEVDDAHGTRGQESLSLVAETAGDYQFKVWSREKEPAPGQYQVSITEDRTATPMDSQRVAAEHDFAAGELLSKGKTKEALEQAIPKYDAARQGWREVNDARGEASALLAKGRAYFYSSKMLESVASYEEALRLLRTLPDQLDVAVTLLNIGISKLSMAESATARDYFTQALDVFIAVDDQKYVGFTLYQIGRTYYLEGDIEQARDYYNRALPIRHALHDRQGEAYTLLALGRIYANWFSDNEQALTFYNKALAFLKETSENRLAAQTLGDIGRLYFSEGDYSNAISRFNDALKLVADGDALVRAELLTYVGMVYSAQGRAQEAIDNYYSKALALQRQGEDHIGAGHTLKNIGVAYASKNADGKALEYLNEALGVWVDVKYRTAEADTRYEIARVESRLGSLQNIQDARAQMELALPTLETLRNRIANQTLRTSYFASVQKYYELYIDLLMRQYAQTHDKEDEALALHYSERARARSLLDTLIEAHAEIREDVDPKLLELEAAVQYKLSLLSQRQMLGKHHTQAQAAIADQNIAALLSQYQEIEGQLRSKSPRYASLVYPEPATLGQIQGKLLDADQLLLEYALGEERSYLWAVTPTSIASYVLPKRVEIETAAEHVRSLLTARNQVIEGETDYHRLARIQRADAEYGPAAAALSRMLLGKVETLSAATRLVVVSDGELQYLPFAALPLPEKVEVERSDRRTKAIAANKPLPLLSSHEIETQPSISLLAELRRESSGAARPAPTKLIAIIADPVFNEDDERFEDVGAQSGARSKKDISGVTKPHSSSVPSEDKARTVLKRAGLVDARGYIARLAFTRREADAIMDLTTPGEGMEAIDFKARMKLVLSGELAQYRIIHFATHSLVDKEHPELSGILLSLLDEQHTHLDGLLQMHEIYKLHLPAELVVLSACETGLGKMVKGEGISALSRGFMYAGAKRIIASLWEVSDSYTAELMASFYGKLLREKRMRQPQALRAAQLEMMLKHPEKPPYFWAAFIIQGDST